MKKIIKWLDNFWYHYKWPTLIIGFLVIAVSVMSVQYITRDRFDLSVVYAGPFDPTANQTRAIETELGKLIGEDFNGDNKKNCQLNEFFLLTDEQYVEIQK